MVAIIFRYPSDVTLTPTPKAGQLPEKWENHVYIPLWDTIFPLFTRLAQQASIEPERNSEFAPDKMFFRSQSEKDFALFYAEGAKSRIQSVPYTEIKALGGADWVYRQLLESKMSLFEHFRGSGRTQNEVFDKQGKELGWVEFVGPNRKIKDLPEVAIIDLGRLTITDRYFEDNPAQ